MTTRFTIVASIFGIISGLFHKQGSSGLSIFFGSIAIIALFLALSESWTSEAKNNKEERRILLTACLKIIDARTRLTVENIGEFRFVFKQYRYTLTEEQNGFIGSLLSAVGDLRINNEELTGLDECKERTDLISGSRLLLNKIEKSRLVIEEYLRQT